jgi:methylenetetrahydrofolate reductase (NADPH)
MHHRNISLSFEFFPPKTETGDQHLEQTWRKLKAFQPEFFSVTFGAGGTTQEKTTQIISRIQGDGLNAAPHLSCIGSSRNQIEKLILAYQEKNIHRIVALRGDYPSGMMNTGGDFNHATELVQFIRHLTQDHFHIEVAAYPEFHPQAKDAFSDLRHFKQKVEAGANSAITQYFYNAESYFEFLESCSKLNINIPIVPGIMPIYDYEKLIRFSRVCGAEVPLWLEKRLHVLQGDPIGLRQYGIEVVARLCERLLQGGAPGLHFYTLNQTEPTASILKLLSINATQPV